MKKTPCKDCPDRHYKCHSTCENYIQFKKESDRIRDKRGEISMLNGNLNEIEAKRLKKLGYVCGKY